MPSPKPNIPAIKNPINTLYKLARECVKKDPEYGVNSWNPVTKSHSFNIVFLKDGIRYSGVEKITGKIIQDKIKRIVL